MSTRDAQRAWDESRTKLKTAAKAVDEVLNKIASGAWFTYSAAEGTLRSDKDAKAEYRAVTTALQAARTDLSNALKATDTLAAKLQSAAK
jgi:hypothetical protein